MPVRTAKIARAVLCSLVSVLFVYEFVKLAHLPYGYSVALAILIGIAEASCAISLWNPKFATASIIGLALIMAGAIFTLLHFGQPRLGGGNIMVSIMLVRTLLNL